MKAFVPAPGARFFSLTFDVHMADLILFNKPYQVLSQFTDDQGRDTLANYLAAPDFRVAGRLDYDSEGLLLLTDDGRLQQQIANPRHKLWKTYLAQVEGQITEEAIQQLCSGVILNDGATLPARARRIDPPCVPAREPPVRARKTVADSWLELAIREGRNRQVRRMTAAVGYPTLRLLRTRIGNWTLQGLKPGDHLKETINMPSRTQNPGTRGKRRK